MGNGQNFVNVMNKALERVGDVPLEWKWRDMQTENRLRRDRNTNGSREDGWNPHSHSHRMTISRSRSSTLKSTTTAPNISTSSSNSFLSATMEALDSANANPAVDITNVSSGGGVQTDLPESKHNETVVDGDGSAIKVFIRVDR